MSLETKEKLGDAMEKPNAQQLIEDLAAQLEQAKQENNRLRKNASETLARSESVYREVIESIAGVPYRFRYTDRTYEFFGSGIDTLFGIPAEKFTHNQFGEITKKIVVMNPDAPSDPFEYGRAFRNGEFKTYKVDLLIRTPQGIEKWISDTSVPVLNEGSGEVVGSQGILQDITERKKEEEKSQSKLRHISTVHEASIITMDTHDPHQLARSILQLLSKIMPLDAFIFTDYDEVTHQMVDIVQADTLQGKLEIWETYNSYSPTDNVLMSRLKSGQPLLELRKPDQEIKTNLYPFGNEAKRSASLMFAVMKCLGKPNGLISVQSYQYNAYNGADLDLLVDVANVVGGGLVRIRAEKARDRFETIYRKAIENASGVPYQFRYQDNGYEFIGSGIEELLGIASHEFTFSRFREIIQEMDVQDSNAPSDSYEYGKSFIQGKSKKYRVDFRIKTPRGEDKWISDCAIPVLDSETKKVVGSLGILQDITERKRIEKALKEANQTLKTMIQNSPAAIIVQDLETRIKLWNPAAERIFGWTHEEVIDQPCPVMVNQESSATPMDFYNNPENLNVSNQEIQCREKSGTLIDVVLSIAPLYDEAGIVTSMIGILSDISNRKQMEVELQKIQKLESVGILAGGIAHDFNNLLTGIMGNISLINIFEGVDSEIKKILQETEDACVRASDLTQQLLTFSKGGVPVRQSTSIRDLLHNTVLFALRGSNIRCEMEFSDPLWTVEIDKGQISQVLNNLTLNAQQAMPQGGIIWLKVNNINITATERLPLAPGKYIHIHFEDQGEGIPETHLSRIFDPYFTTKQKGSGLGLAISYSIIKNHGGLITVRSKVGVGTVFHIYLPAMDKQEFLEKKPVQNIIQGKGKVLLMDDEDILIHIVGKMLSCLGYEFVASSNGSEAISTYQKALKQGHPFDVVILDLTIPGGMGGKDTIKILAEIDPAVKAIVSSGYSDDPIMAEFEKYGFCGVMAKPYNLLQLSETLASVLQPDNA